MTEWKKISGISGNSVLKGDGFYVSYLPPGGMPGIFGADNGGSETALCKDGGFLILNGDYRKEYESIYDQGYDACLKFYEENIENKSSWSESKAS